MAEEYFRNNFEAKEELSESKNPYKLSLRKPDGRLLHLYAREKIAANIIATNPHHEKITAATHLRWHPWREEWVAYASHRQNRTFLPPPEYNPLLPSASKDFPTELPVGNYEAAVFENLFPSLSVQEVTPPELYVPTRLGEGVCEVVVFTQDPKQSLGSMPVSHIELILYVLRDRYKELQQRKDILYVLPFENRGVEMGVTLHHPHGQIYAYPVLPPIQQQMLTAQKKYWEKSKATLLSHMIEEEIAVNKRVIYQDASVISFVPVCARYPFEVWVAPTTPHPTLADFSSDEIMHLARALKITLLKYDGLWQKPFPYLMAFYASPNDGLPHPEWHFHIEFYPPLRARDKLKYLAGTELGANFFINDTLPEEKAAELKAVRIEDFTNGNV